MITINGKFNTAKVYAKALELECEEQIKLYLDHPLFGDTIVRIMPDVHLGKAAVIGFTATCNGYVVPDIVGVDIGCGVSAFNLGKGEVVFDKLDKFIRKNIPAGKEVNTSPSDLIETAFNYVSDGFIDYESFVEAIKCMSKKVGTPVARVFNAFGSLGGGNHFIEIDRDEEKNRWLLIHSGSRNFGLNVAQYHIDLAVKRTHEDSNIKFLTGFAADEYMHDMRIAQLYARVNRAVIGLKIGSGYFKVPKKKMRFVESIHNYIDFDQNILRKGAISAREGESVIIPFSMADGAIVGVGKGNAEWNCSAPHGSGRKMSRTKSKGLSLDEYKKRMKNIWSSCVNKSTLDESPMVYKKSGDILELIGETVEIESRLMPIYNFKADK